MNILLADDQSEVRSALRILLEHESNYNIIGEAAELQSLLIQLEANSPDLVLLDWEFGCLRVSDIIPALKAICPSIKIVALSSHPESAKSALATGAHAFVSKIDHPESLLDVLRNIENKA